MSDIKGGSEASDFRPSVIDLSRAPGSGEAWDRPKGVVYLWAVCELLVVFNPWQPSSFLRRQTLRVFGAEIGPGVILRPRVRVKFPWKLHVGANTWIGEGVWFHNQDHVYIGENVVISQESFLTTGSHRARTDMGLITSPIHIGSGAWVTSRCMVLGGSTIGESALIQPLTVVRGEIPANTVFGCADGPMNLGPRFPDVAGTRTPGKD